MKVSKCSNSGTKALKSEYPLSYGDILKEPGVYLMAGNITTMHVVYGRDDKACFLYDGSADWLRPVPDSWKERSYKRLEGATVCFEIRQKDS